MAKILDIGLENTEKSLGALSDFLQHSIFKSRPYEVDVSILLHAFVCLTASYAIWQFISSDEQIVFAKAELAISIMYILAGWFVGACVFAVCLKLSKRLTSFKSVLKLYVFVHANVVLICSIVSLLLFVMTRELASQDLSFVADIRQYSQSDGVEQVILQDTQTFSLTVVQIVFLLQGMLMLLVYQPAHFKTQTQASWVLLLGITFILVAASVGTQLYLWISVDSTTSVVGRVLRAPGLIPP